MIAQLNRIHNELEDIYNIFKSFQQTAAMLKMKILQSTATEQEKNEIIDIIDGHHNPEGYDDIHPTSFGERVTFNRDEGLGDVDKTQDPFTIDAKDFKFIDVSKIDFPHDRVKAKGGIESFIRNKFNVHIISGSEYIQTPFFRNALGVNTCAEFKSLIEVFEHDKGLSKPTPCQMISWPTILSGHNLICISKTGSGKTFAFMIPGLIHCVLMARKRNIQPSYVSAQPIMVVVGPTRELVTQIKDSSVAFAHKLHISLAAVYGGEANRNTQHKELGNNPLCICGTPGRLKDFIGEGVIDLKFTSMFVLDEADRMLDMKFGRDISMIAKQLPPMKLLGFFSATWETGGSSAKLADSLMCKEFSLLHIQIGDKTDGDYSLVDTVQQEIKIINNDNEKKKFVERLFTGGRSGIPESYHKYAEGKCVLFCNTKDQVGRLASHLEYAGIACKPMSGDLSQEGRERVLSSFRAGELQLLLATDVVGRGIDIDDVNIINYEFPSGGKEAYTHRVGRSGRAGRKGFALTLLTHKELQGRAAHEMYELLEGDEKNKLASWVQK